MFPVHTAAGRIVVLVVTIAVLVGFLLWSKRATSHSFFLGVLVGTGLVLSFDIPRTVRRGGTIAPGLTSQRRTLTPSSGSSRRRCPVSK
jgi:hypothetical protein